MARKVGQIPARGDRGWLTRVDQGRNYGTTWSDAGRTRNAVL